MGSGQTFCYSLSAPLIAEVIIQRKLSSILCKEQPTTYSCVHVTVAKYCRIFYFVQIPNTNVTLMQIFVCAPYRYLICRAVRWNFWIHRLSDRFLFLSTSTSVLSMIILHFGSAL